MTREEAKIILECMATDIIGAMAGMRETMPMLDVLRQRVDAINIALTALRAPTREQVEKVWRGCEWCNGEHSNNGEISAYAEVECEGCDAGNNCPNAHSSDDPCYGMVDRALPVNFCPSCGAPMTDKAVDMVMERMEVLYGQENT